MNERDSYELRRIRRELESSNMRKEQAIYTKAGVGVVAIGFFLLSVSSILGWAVMILGALVALLPGITTVVNASRDIKELNELRNREQEDAEE